MSVHLLGGLYSDVPSDVINVYQPPRTDICNIFKSSLMRGRLRRRRGRRRRRRRAGSNGGDAGGGEAEAAGWEKTGSCGRVGRLG